MTELRRLFHALLLRGNLKKTEPPLRSGRADFAFTSVEGLSALFDPKWGIYLSANRRVLKVAVQQAAEGTELKWVTVPLPRRFHFWKRLVENAQDQRHLAGMSDFVEREILPKLFPNLLEASREVIAGQHSLTWEQFSRTLRWLEWASKRTAAREQLDEGTLFQLSLPNRSDQAAFSRPFRLNIELTEDTFFPQVSLAFPPDGNLLIQFLSQIERTMSDPTEVAEVATDEGGETRSGDVERLRRLVNAKGLVCDSYRLNRSTDSNFSRIFTGLNASSGDWLLDFYPRIRRTPLNEQTAIGLRWKKFFEFLLSRRLMPLSPL